jgi:hypothetical protein
MRGSGWRLIGFTTTQRAVEVSAVLIVLFPFWQAFLGLTPFFYGMFAGLIFLIPLALWTFYTYLENRSFRELEKKFALKLIIARILSTLGIISYASAYGYGVFTHRSFDSFYSLMVFPFIYGVFAAPFLILCSLILIVRLGDVRMPAPKMAKNGSKRAHLHDGWIFGAMILLSVILIGSLVYFPVQIIGLGDEAKGFPVEETSLTVWNWTTALTVNVTGIAKADPQYYQQYAVLNVSLRNIASHEVYFGINDSFNRELQQAKTKNLFLEYRSGPVSKGGWISEIAHSETNALDIGWGITLTEKLSSLTPNQSANGSIYFIIHRGWTPENLFCNDTNGRLFTVALNN